MATEVPVCAGASCELLGPFGIFVQCMIACWCVLTLFLMWCLEKPRRTCLTWFGDMSKQILGAGYSHCFNVMAAMVFGSALRSSLALNNQCVWYLVAFLTDIVLVTLLSWAVIIIIRPILKSKLGLDIGDYEGHTPECDLKTNKHMSPATVWVFQTFLWIIILTVVKIFVLAIVYFTQDVCYDFVAFLFRMSGLCDHLNGQLVTSVVIVPLVGDALQLIVQDGFLKKQTRDDASQGFLD